MDAPFVTTLFFGFVLGMEHALDADHVVAVSTIVSHSRSLWRSAVIRTPLQGILYILVSGADPLPGCC